MLQIFIARKGISVPEVMLLILVLGGLALLYYPRWIEKRPPHVELASSLTPGENCILDENSDNLFGPRFIVERIVINRIGWTIFPDNRSCVASGKKYDLLSIALAESGQPYAFYLNHGKVTLDSFFYVQYQDLTQDLSNLIENNYPLASLRTEIERYFGKQPPATNRTFIFAKVRIESIYLGAPEQSNPPSVHPGAKIVDKEGALALIDRGAYVLDFRLAKFFGQDSLPGAKNHPYEILDENFKTLYSASEILSLTDNFSLLGLPSDKNKEILIYGHGFDPVEGGRAVVHLVAAGYVKLFWFRGGTAEWLGRSITTPLNPKTVKIVDHAQALELKKEGAVFIDVRVTEPRPKSGRAKIVGAKWIPYIQGRSANGLYNFMGEFGTVGNFSAAKDTFDINKIAVDKAAQIVIYGQNEKDWGAYKAALWLHTSGWKKVYWFRGGVVEWHGARRLFPLNGYEIEKD